jgi:hypothetical protein
MDRRNYLRVGTMSSLLATLPWFPQAVRAGSGTGPRNGPLEPTHSAKRCILIWLDGGPSHLEMFDPKPSAPAEVRGPFSTIPTTLAGVRFSELLPELARRTNDLAVIRSMTSPLGEHNLGTHYMLTGYKPTPAINYPAFGNVLGQLKKHTGELPRNIAIPNHRVGGSNFSPAGFLGNAKRPFDVGGDPAQPDFRVSDLNWYPSLDAQRVNRRERFLRSVEELASQGTEQLDPQFEQAFRLLQSKSAKSAFDLSLESKETRQRYGGKSIGQCCLLARRLIESGVSFVTVNNTGWDTHNQMVTRLRDGYSGARVPVGLIPSLDTAVSALIDDLRDRNLLDETLIVVMGEFGRTPKLNVNAGRDHWPRVFSAMLAGGGIRGGTIYGESDAKGESPKSNPVSPAQLVATIYKLMGVDPETKLTSPDGRPIAISNGRQPIEALIG